ncbi:MAG: efflux RND transporter periplasmic adaptor subunit [Deltaproteobacteria bacterium]|nr:efflux RND transporter periplasmic adaptor subunit [Deltaproteobacteria bacterium]
MSDAEKPQLQTAPEAEAASHAAPGKWALRLAGLLRWLLVLAMMGAAGGTWWHAHAPKTEAGAEPYTCPMHPTYVIPGKGSCPICGMDLVPQASLADDASPTADPHAHYRLDGVSGVAPVRIDTGRLQRAGVRAAQVERRDIAVEHAVIGGVSRDPARSVAVTARTGGWVQNLTTLLPGEPIARGAAVAQLYSRELQEAQAEFLATAHGGEVGQGEHALRAAAGERLMRLGMGKGAVSGLGSAKGTVSLVAPQDGVVLERPVLQGAYVGPGQAVLVLGAADAWLTMAEVPVGAGAALDGLVVQMPDGATCAAETLPRDPADGGSGVFSRLRARLRCASTVPYAGVQVRWTWRRVERDVLAVPDEAVVETGDATYVYRTDNAGRMLPTRVRTGLRADGHVAIAAGLAQGDWVVVSAAFVVDAEARLAAAAEKPKPISAPPADDPHAAHRAGGAP